MLLRLIHLGVANIFAALRLMTTSDRAKDIEILALRHQIMVLQRQRPALLPALLHQVPRNVVRRLRLLVRPDTILRWHRRFRPAPPCGSLPAQAPESPFPSRASAAGTAPCQQKGR
ncbi:hypothetical protein [Micromonospora sp. NPDC005806]|uniref:hypothetical protein n=1 Tax=Micromonospora sp. NPDC005806 TaxID=3364234 RepID=UPI00367E3DD2